jgi:hypothetical protein
LWFASIEGGGGGWGVVGVFEVCGRLLRALLRGWVVYLCVSTPLADGWAGVTVLVSVGWLATQTFLAPPSSLLRLNPSVLIPKEGDHRRSPFQAMCPCDLAMLPSSMIVMRRNVIV